MGGVLLFIRSDEPGVDVAYGSGMGISPDRYKRDLSLLASLDTVPETRLFDQYQRHHWHGEQFFAEQAVRRLGRFPLLIA